jgi:hypothetical protein
MFTRTGKYASITALVVMLSHQVTVRLIAQNEKKEEASTTKRLQTLESCLKAILVVVLVCSFSYEYAKVWQQTSVLSFLFGERKIKKD